MSHGPGVFFGEMHVEKVYTTTERHLSILKSRGLKIDDDSLSSEILEKDNYYNLINGYKGLFLEKKREDGEEKYLQNANFNEVCALYYFDRELRSLFLRYILQIENSVKSVLAHKFSEKYCHDNYLKIANFETSLKNGEQRTQAQKIGKVTELIAKLQSEISHQLSKNNPMVSHYMLEYGYVPLWVLVNTLSIGTISKFYDAMRQKDQNSVGLPFRLKPDEMSRILSLLTIYRNACAHDERLYSLRANGSGHNMIKTNRLHKKLGIPLDKSGNPICGKNDLFAVVIIFKMMLPQADFDKFCLSMDELLSELSTKLHAISTEAVLKEMGFPNNWDKIRNI